MFGRGYLTWEWIGTNDTGPIRSHIHPLIFVPIMYLFRVTRLDTYWIIALAPRVIQGLITALGDVHIAKFHELNFGKGSQKWFLFLYVTNIYILFCGSRTLINTLEMNLTSIALFHYSKSISCYEDDHHGAKKSKTDIKKKSNQVEVKIWQHEIIYVIIISSSFIMRPTTAVFWIPLVLYHINILYKKSLIITTLVTRLIPCAASTLLVLTSIDSKLYGKVVFIPWNFLKINVLKNISSQYGIEPWYYYFTHTLLPLLNISSIFAIGGISQLRNYKKDTSIYIAATMWTLGVLSTIEHKEQRFILPLFPVILCYAAKFSHEIIIRRELHRKAIATSVLVLNILPLIYLLFWHKVGPTNVVSNLAKEFNALGNDSYYKKDILFLLPCHSAPFYSHFHLDYQLDFLKCPPVIISDAEQYSNGLDESDFFFQFPEKWLENNFQGESRKDGRKLPSHLVIFDTQANLDVFKKFASTNGFEKCMDIYNTLFSENKRHGTRIHVYCRKKNK